MNYFVAGTVVGMIFAIVVSMIHYRVQRMGTLHIDDTDPETTKYNIEITSDLDMLANKKSCVIKIDHLTSKE